ncbi:phage recombination protein Bet, partial [Escherichia coli EC1869]
MDECRREPFKTREGKEIIGPWQSHPKRMLRHKAMIQCARLAFGFAGIYDKDEAERIVENT